MAKYYAVKKGRKTGIFTTWNDCQKQVNGFSGAIFKSFNSEQEAKDFIGNNPQTNIKPKPVKITKTKITNNRKIALTLKQQNALQVMLEGNNTFITGKAGTGKSFIINYFINEVSKQNKNVLVCAPTGIAAININGVTIHRCFHASLQPLINPIIKKVPSQIKSADIIIVDEISMCRIDLFEYMIKVIEKTNKKIQLIVVGDFFQLPPVTTKNDLEVLKQVYHNYNKGFAFESDKWNQCNFTTINLTEVIRQNDNDFIKHLNMIRIGNNQGIDYFNQHQNQKFNNGITLSALNRVVNKINQNELAKLQTPLYTYEAKINGEVKPSDKPTDDLLELKVGARVMVLINDNDLINFQNGSLGTVVKLDEEKVTVCLDQNNRNITFTYHEWSIENYIVEKTIIDDITEHHVIKNKIGSFIQIPLRLAYAITIHKSQGQTYDQVNLIPYSFDCGQLYVALSRVKTIDGLHLMEPMISDYLITDHNVKKFYHIDPTPKIDKRQIFEQLGKDIYQLDPIIKEKLPLEIKQLLLKTENLLNIKD